MNTRLQRIVLQNFRCVSGTVMIPLNAPVVLIHGPNGTGKTSILSAIELVLTGYVSAMLRFDDSYLSHVVNRPNTFARITLEVSGLDSHEKENSTITIQDGELVGTPLLSKALSHVFAERCNLAQSTLGRLLEIYQHSSPRNDSPLTRFVKDLLGLDQLEAIIDGLYSAGDVRNTRRIVPRYKETEERKIKLAEEQDTGRLLIEEVQNDITKTRLRLSQQLEALGNPSNWNLDLPNARERLEQLLSTDIETHKLIAITQKRREIIGMLEEWRSLSRTEGASERLEAEAAVRLATAQAINWRNTVGKELETLLDHLRETFPDLPSSASTDPELARETAFGVATKELRRCDQLIAEADAATQEVASLEQRILNLQTRSVVIDDQISGIAGDTDAIARNLALLIPQITDEECPVCGRDFREVSEEPLVTHLSHRVARLTELSGTLEALSGEKGRIAEALLQAERDIRVAKNKEIRQDARITLKARVSFLTECVRKLSGLAPNTAEGLTILQNEATAQKVLSQLRIHDQRVNDLRAAVIACCMELGQSPPAETDALDDVISTLEADVLKEDERLKSAQVSRQEALISYRDLLEIEGRLGTLVSAHEKRAKVLDLVEGEFNRAEKRRLDFKHIASTARDVRTAIISRVFNDSLNALWRDLFVRLAPSEAFVPAFRIPQSDREVMAILETVHRDGGHGGAPGTMLSAGNLNTAALTLFLALHLSAKAQLPWLVLDDPVQSMDEVHITQFAALLRTLSKRHGRQIIMAVHDRPLFEYLTLELSPAFQDDQLITVELSQNQTGTTIAEPEFRRWEPDTVAAWG